MSRFIAIVATPSNKHKMVICPIFETIEETEQEAKRTQVNYPVKILDIDWTVDKQLALMNRVAELQNQVIQLQGELHTAKNQTIF